MINHVSKCTGSTMTVPRQDNRGYKGEKQSINYQSVSYQNLFSARKLRPKTQSEARPDTGASCPSGGGSSMFRALT